MALTSLIHLPPEEEGRRYRQIHETDHRLMVQVQRKLVELSVNQRRTKEGSFVAAHKEDLPGGLGGALLLPGRP